MSLTIHDRARQLSAQKQIPLSEAYSALAKRRARVKRRASTKGFLWGCRGPEKDDGIPQDLRRFWWNET